MDTLMNTDAHTDEDWMRLALAASDTAAAAGEVPVGAVVVADNQLIATGYNQQISLADPTAHAEVVALRAAAAKRANYRLTDVTLYVTLEPCTMCVGAAVHARVKRIVYGTAEPRAGATGLLATAYFNHYPKIDAPCLEAECAQRLTTFFRARRRQRTDASEN